MLNVLDEAAVVEGRLRGDRPGRRAVQLRRRRPCRRLNQMKDEDLDFAFNLNVRAMVRTDRAVLPGMIDQAAAPSSTPIDAR